MPNRKHDAGDYDHINPRFDFDVDAITSLYAWIAKDRETGREGIIAATRHAQRTLLIATSEERAMKMKKAAESVARSLDVTIHCVRFRRD